LVQRFPAVIRRALELVTKLDFVAAHMAAVSDDCLVIFLQLHASWARVASTSARLETASGRIVTLSLDRVNSWVPTIRTQVVFAKLHLLATSLLVGTLDVLAIWHLAETHGALEFGTELDGVTTFPCVASLDVCEVCLRDEAFRARELVAVLNPIAALLL
jgi:hypothetical protein